MESSCHAKLDLRRLSRAGRPRPCVPPQHMAPPLAADVSAATCYRDASVPDLGMEANAEYAYRVYCIECQPPAQTKGPFYYVGIAHKPQIKKRLQCHFGGNGGALHAGAPTEDDSARVSCR